MPIFDSFISGVNAGQQQADRNSRRRVGSLMSGGDYAGASRAAYEGGDLQAGNALGAQGRAAQMAPMLAQGQFDQAMQIPGIMPDEMQAIAQFRNSANEQERALAAEKFSLYGSIAAGLLNVPADQRQAEALRLAPIIGMDPATITPEMLSDSGLQTLIARSMGAADYMRERRAAEKDARDATRPIVTPYGIMMPPGASVPGMPSSSPSPAPSDPPPPAGFVPARPNQAPARTGAERNQTPTVSFGSTDEARSHIGRLVPGVGFTSGTRSADHNARVGGVPTSYHLRGRAWDLTPPRGMSMDQLAAKMRQAGFRVLNEGDHVHVSW